MSAQLAIANPRRIKAAHRRRRKCASAHREYQHTDALGSPVAVTDQNRNVIERTEYEPYGKVINRPPRDGINYTGHVEDAATGLLYAQQRYLDRDLGRFLSVDPVTAYGGDYRYFNRYAYAFNNPYSFTDPDGRCNQFINGIVGGLPCEMQQRNLNPAHVAADAAVARDARMIVETQGEIALLVGGGVAARSGLALTGIKADTKTFKFLCVLGLSGCGSNPVLSEIKSPGKATTQIADDVAGHLRSRAETIGRSTERLRRDSPGMRPPPGRDGAGAAGSTGSSGSASSGFQGTFRVEGRLDARRLDKELSGK
jgi:RHS repeat-associated protein